MPTPRFDRLLRPRERATRVVFATVATLALLVVLLLASLGALNERTAGPTPTAAVSTAPAAVTSPTPAPSPTATQTRSPSPLPPGTFENPVLGYRITLPEGYGRSRPIIITGREDLGVDVYTPVTEEAREACQRDRGDVPPPTPDQGPPVVVGVARNVRGLSAMEWATTARSPGAQPLSTHQKVEQVTVGGHEAVRLVADNVTAVTNAFVVRANDRMYELYPTQSQPSGFPKTWLDDIAKTFVVIEPAPFPTPTATTPPREAARELAAALARAFAAKDGDAVARLMPDCWVGVSYAVDGTAPGQGPLNRSVFLFSQAVRDRFARGDLTVTVDPTVQVQADPGGDLFFVRSEWTEPDRTTRIDLFLAERDGRWQWLSARHQYQRADLIRGYCAPYRSPWVSATGSC